MSEIAQQKLSFAPRVVKIHKILDKKVNLNKKVTLNK